MLTRLRNAGRRACSILRSWQLPALLGAALLIALLWWVSPWKVRVRVDWDATNLARAAALWWLWCLFALGAAAWYAVRRHLGKETWQRAWGARFFLGSVAAHILLLLILGWWTLPGVMQMIVTRAEVEPFPDIPNDNRDLGEDGRRAFEKVADLEESEPSPSAERVAGEVGSAEIQPVEKLAPTIPAAVARTLPPEQVLFVPPPEIATAPLAEQPESSPLPRRSPLSSAGLLIPEEVVPTVAPIPSPAEPEIPSQVALAPQPPLTNQTPSPTELRPELASARPQPAMVAIDDSPEPPSIEPLPPTASLKRQSVEAGRQAAVIREDVQSPSPVEPTAETAADIASVPDAAVPARRDVTGPAVAVLPRRAPVVTALVATAQPVSTAAGAATVEADQELPPAVPAPLVRNVRTTATAVELAATADPPEIMVTAAETPQEAEVARTEATLPAVAASTVEPASPLPRSPLLPRRPPTASKAVRLEIEAPDVPDFATSSEPPERVIASRGRIALPRTQADLPSMFALRDEETRRQYIELFGGTPATEEAVNRGLVWLARHQNPNGSWSLHEFHVPEGEPKVAGAGQERSNTAATGLALLAFLGGRHTHQSGGYQQTVAAALDWIVSNQHDNGDLLAAGDNQQMYSHGIAAIALCEAYGISRDPALQEPCRKALEFIVQAQHAEGGWRYKPGERGDTSVVGWQMMALKSGEMAGVPVEQAAIDRLRSYLARVEGNKPVGGQFGYQGPQPTPPMTAEGLLCLQFLDEDRNSPRMRAGADYLLKHLPDASQSLTSYYWYYGTQVMYHMQGDYWEAWNGSVRDLLVESQIKDGPLAGTWDPRDRWEQRGGRLYATALKLLMLEVYYRHLPLYEQLNDR